jgi:hypothetical protein
VKVTLPAPLTSKDRKKNKSALTKIKDQLPEKALAEFEKFYAESHFGKELKPEAVITSLDPLVFQKNRSALDAQFKRIKTMTSAIETGAKNAAEHNKSAAAYATALAKAARSFFVQLDREYQAFVSQLDKTYKAKLKASPGYLALELNASEIRPAYNRLRADMTKLDRAPSIDAVHDIWGGDKTSGRGFITKVGTWRQAVKQPFPEMADSVWKGDPAKFLRLPWMDELADEQTFKVTIKLKEMVKKGMREEAAVAKMLTELEHSLEQTSEMCDHLEDAWAVLEKASK